MNIQIVDASDIKYKEIVCKLVELYLYELSKELQFDVNEHGIYGDEDVNDAWNTNWSDKLERHPFLVKVDNQFAGFAVVDKRKHYLKDEVGYDMAEFFIMKKYTGSGVGKSVAKKLFDSFKGNWQVSVKEKNKSAQLFWQKVIGQYTENKLERLELKTKEWFGPVYYFEN